MNEERNPALSGLLVKTTEVLNWVSMVAAEPSPAGYLAALVCIAIFGEGKDSN